MHAKAIAIRGGIKEGKVTFIPKGKEELAKKIMLSSNRKSG